MAHLRFPNSEKAPLPLGERLVIGRSPDQADLAVDDKRLSRKHCELVKAGATYTIRDLGSANGVRVNGGDKITQHTLKDGDQLSLGGYLITFHAGDPAPDGNKAVLRVIKGVPGRMTYPLDPVPFTIGRKDGCDLVLPNDSQASALHARILRTGSGAWRIVDLGSTNGTKVDGKAVVEQELEDGAQIAVGSALLRFQLANAAEVAAPGTSPEDFDFGGMDDIDLESADAPSAEPVIKAGATAARAAANAPTTFIPDAATARVAKTEVEELDLSGGSDDDGDDKDAAPVVSVKVNTSGSGPKLKMVRVAEIAVAVIILGAVGWFLMELSKRSAEGTGTGSDGGLVGGPVGKGGMLVNDPRDGFGNPSFEAGEGAVSGIPYWSTAETTPFDSVSPLADIGKGGIQVMRIQRSTDTAGRTVVECQKYVEVHPDKGYTGKVWIRRNGDITGGAGFMVMRWYSGKNEAVPIRTDSFGFTPGSPEWAEVAATFVAPSGAKAAKFAVGYAGKRGELLFDEARLDPVIEGAAVRKLPLHGPNRRVRLDASARLNVLGLTGAAMLTNGTFELIGGSVRDPRLDHTDWLVETPGESEGKWTLRVFDPTTEGECVIEVTPTGDGFSSRLRYAEGSTYLRSELSTLATSALFPEGSASAVRQEGKLVAWGTQVEVNGPSTVEVTDVQAASVLKPATGYRHHGQSLIFPATAGGIAVDFEFQPASADYRALLNSVRGENDEGSSDADKLTAGLALATRFPLEGEGVASAAEAVEAAANSWWVRGESLAATVKIGAASTRDAQRFLSAVAEAEALAAEIGSRIEEWRGFGPALAEVQLQPAYPRTRKDQVGRMIAAIEGLAQVRANFARIQTEGANEAFVLRAERQRLGAEPMLASALDHFGLSEMVQARIKFTAVIDQFPHTRAATRARLRLLDIADALLVEAAQHDQDGLRNMAKEAAGKAGIILKLVQDSSALLARDNILQRLERGLRPPADLEDWRSEQRNLEARAEEFKKTLEKRGD